MRRSYIHWSIATIIGVLLYALQVGGAWWKVVLLTPFVFFIFYLTDLRDAARRQQNGLPVDDDET